MKLSRICLVTSLHLSYNPRVLKEADALHEAGHDVRVVAMKLESEKAHWDEQLMANRGWQLERLDACRDSRAGRMLWLKSALRQRLYQRSRWLRRLGTGLEKAYCRHFPEMAGLTMRKSADLFIAHNLQALPAAALAARRWKTKLGFDAEDFHRGEIAENDSSRAALRQFIQLVEAKFIPQCEHLTAASDGIGDAYATALGVRKPVTVLNVFPLSERDGRTPRDELQQERRGNGLSLYWYSQVIGEGRGLEDVLGAMALLGKGVNLCLRGTWAEGYERIFRERARTLGVENQVHVLPVAPPEQLVERAAQHDVGLALEPDNTQNRGICVSNKILSYFLAGLAIAATDVPGQRGIMETAPEAGCLFPPGDAHALATRLREWLDQPAKLKAAKANSKSAGENRFCWEHEKGKLVGAVAHALER